MAANKTLKLGSLFDGIGGFPYAATALGIEPLWASEILRQAVSVTQRHFPNMRHVGDVTKLSGSDLEPVDIITFGSPCQGLSVAGKRLGLADERSGLFTEAIRIIYEMREATNGQYPRWALWENVPGCFASGTPAGSDFRAVLEAFTKTEIPMPESGKWANFGMVRGGGVDVAWTLYNAADFGLAQRRKRVFALADFGAASSAEILFVPRRVPRNPASGGASGQRVAADAESGVAFADRSNCLTSWDKQQSRIYMPDGCSPTLAGADGGGGRNPGGLVAAFLGGASDKARSIGYSETEFPTLKSGASGFNAPCVCEPQVARTLTARADSSACADRGQNVVAVPITVHDRLHSMPIHENAADTLVSTDSKGTQLVFTPTAYGITSIGSNSMASSNPNSGFYEADTSRTLDTNGGRATGNQGGMLVVGTHPDIAGTLVASGAGLSRTGGMGSEPDLCVAYALQANMIGRADTNGPQGSGVNEEISFTLTGTDKAAVAYGESSYGGYAEGDVSSVLTAVGGALGGGSETLIAAPSSYVVRRLTPTECERLMGYEDAYTLYGADGKQISDSRRYMMLGNSVAVPCVAYILAGIVAESRGELYET